MHAHIHSYVSRETYDSINDLFVRVLAHFSFSLFKKNKIDHSIFSLFNIHVLTEIVIDFSFFL